METLVIGVVALKAVVGFAAVKLAVAPFQGKL